jgi:hypothetical protein
MLAIAVQRQLWQQKCALRTREKRKRVKAKRLIDTSQTCSASKAAYIRRHAAFQGEHGEIAM